MNNVLSLIKFIFFILSIKNKIFENKFKNELFEEIAFISWLKIRSQNIQNK